VLLVFTQVSGETRHQAVPNWSRAGPIALDTEGRLSAAQTMLTARYSAAKVTAGAGVIDCQHDATTWNGRQVCRHQSKNLTPSTRVLEPGQPFFFFQNVNTTRRMKCVFGALLPPRV
jgi:hypothetical protein